MRRSFLNNNEKGITLIALIITIIVMLILAGVTINLTLGENGIFTTAQKAVQNHMDAQDKEIAELGKFENTINETINGLNTNTNNEQEELVAGLYDADGIMLCSWEASGIDVETDYTSSTYKTNTASPYYVLTNTYPTTTSVVLPDSVTGIGNYAFYYCTGLTSIEIPASVTSIGNSAFGSCYDLTNITIPASATSIGSDIFTLCSDLTSIIVSEGNTVYDSRNNCNAIIETSTNRLIVGCEKTVIPDSVTSIGNRAFYHCIGLTSIKIPDSVTSIGVYAFFQSGLISITVGSGLTSIGDSAFSYCTSLNSITVSEENTTYDSRDNCNAIIETSTNRLIVGCRKTVIPASVTSIGNYAFYYCTNLTSIIIPDGITSIGHHAFAECTKLTSVTIPDSVTDIGNYVFAYCDALTSVTIPDSVTDIGNYAFRDCIGLTSVTIPDSVTSIGSSTFNGCSSLTSVTFEDTTTWYVGSKAGTTDTEIDVTDSATNATYLTSTYKAKYWTKTE